MRSLLVALVMALAMCGGPAAVRAGDHLAAAERFLVAWSREDWQGLMAVASPRVPVRIGEHEMTIDLGARTAGAALVLPFRGLATFRMDGEVKGVVVSEITVKVGGEERTGQGALTIERRDGRSRIVRVAVE